MWSLLQKPGQRCARGAAFNDHVTRKHDVADRRQGSRTAIFVHQHNLDWKEPSKARSLNGQIIACLEKFLNKQYADRVCGAPAACVEVDAELLGLMQAALAQPRQAEVLRTLNSRKWTGRTEVHWGEPAGDSAVRVGLTVIPEVSD